MSKYTKVDSSLNFVDRELSVLRFWKDNKIFEQTAAKEHCSLSIRKVRRIKLVFLALAYIF